jgi:hypothetical protein
MIGIMGSVAGADAVAGGVAGPGAEGVVSRPRLFGRLGAARVSVVSAPAGSGKTVLLRSWISWAGVAGSAAWVPVGRGERAWPSGRWTHDTWLRTGQVATAIAWADAGLHIAFAGEFLGTSPTDLCHDDSPGSVGSPVHVGSGPTAHEGRRS